MNSKYIVSLLSGLFLCLMFSSCSDDKKTTSYTSQTKDAQIYSFSINGEHDKSLDSVARAHDSICFIQINKTKFAINQIDDVIYNPDSMPYGTRLKKVLVTTTFNPTYGAGNVKITTPDSINGYIWNRADSVNFAKTSIIFAVNAIGGGTPKSYRIDLRIHKQDPDTLVWKNVSSYPSSIGETKTLLCNNKFYTYSKTNTSLSLFIADDAATWSQKTLSGLDFTVKIESIFYMNTHFYTVDDLGNSYKSADGENWNLVSNGKNIVSVLGILPAIDRADDQLLVILKDGGKNYFGKTKDMTTVETVTYLSNSPLNNEVPSNFPLTKGASYTNFTSDKQTRMLVLTGGLNELGYGLSHTWLFKNIEGGLEIIPFVKNTLFKGAGLSNFTCNGLLYALGGNQFYTSAIWGENWSQAPSKQMLDPNIGKRKGQTVIVDNENYIWLFGGVTDEGVYRNDVWRGRLNRLNP